MPKKSILGSLRSRAKITGDIMHLDDIKWNAEDDDSYLIRTDINQSHSL